MGDIIGVDLYSNPDLAIDPEISAAVAIEGMVRGTFTGKQLYIYFNNDNEDWINARRVINGLDKAVEISQLSSKVYADMVSAEIKPQPDAPAQAGVKSGP
jgi:hypothetical protein